MEPFAIALLVSLAALPLSAQNRIGTGQIKDLYLQSCAACHGQNMEGGQGSSLIDNVWTHGDSDEAIAKIIREGIADTPMIAWQSTLSEEQIRALVILIREQKIIAETTGILEKVKPLGGVFSSELYNFKLEKVADIDNTLWSIAFLPDHSILLTQRDGKLWHVVDSKKSEITGIPTVWIGGQGGLLEVAPHPDYTKNGWIYLSFSDDQGTQINGKDASMTAVVRGRIKNGQWVDQQEIFRAPTDLYIAATGHFGSRFVFKDGYLFFSIGERTKAEMAQDLTKPNGKIHRLFDDGRVPTDNPFYNTPGAYKSIWSYGHRNPQGLALDPRTGELWETEHGPRGGDELNIIQPGRNYGWPVITYGMNYNGKPLTDQTQMEGMEQPIHYWLPSIATAGIDFYEGDAFPKWKYDLLATGMSAQELQRITIVNNKVTHIETILKNQGRVRDVASGPDGLIYVALNTRSPDHGELYRIVPVSEPKWTTLFNGQNLDGWRIRDGDSTVLVDDGMIVAVSQDPVRESYLVTEKTYGDFILELDMKVIGKMSSGIMIRGIDDPIKPDGIITGYQMEVDQSPRQWTGGIYEERARKWLYSLEGKTEARKAYKPSQWNHYRLEAIGDHFRIWVNGIPTLNMVDSKTAEGVIGIQIHPARKPGASSILYLRNIRIIDHNAGDHINGIAIPELVIDSPK